MAACRYSNSLPDISFIPSCRYFLKIISLLFFVHRQMLSLQERTASVMTVTLYPRFKAPRAVE
jgi:hypothetical protein